MVAEPLEKGLGEDIEKSKARLKKSSGRGHGQPLDEQLHQQKQGMNTYENTDLVFVCFCCQEKLSLFQYSCNMLKL